MNNWNEAELAAEKKKLRAQMRLARKEMPESERKKKSSQILHTLIHIPFFRDAEEIWCYVSLPDEVETDGIIRFCLEHGKRVAVPKVEDVTDESGKTDSVLRFYRIRSLDDLAEGTFHVREPVNCEPASDPDAVMILPGLAFSFEGMRMGYGRSYYDRYLLREPHPTAALAFDYSVFPDIPHEKRDVGMEYVITETRVLYCR